MLCLAKQGSAGEITRCGRWLAQSVLCVALAEGREEVQAGTPMAEAGLLALTIRIFDNYMMRQVWL
ncbi:hypothetical protein SAMN05421881_100124 [Nitrosomonas halophila]|uniref:Uncharacterized protein n=1 Tax=Nitrosomonas halophila TaxID=44576 RepID=A0A1H3BHW9_9PROT|nr:hypothetical protein SAMN05421881_100124 [Nitrosomonas halophila]